MSHADQTGSRQFSQNVHEDLLTVGERARVDSANVTSESVDDVMVDLLSLIVLELDDLGMPSLSLDALDNGNRVLSETIGTFIRSTYGFKDTDSLSFFEFFRCDAGTHSSAIK